jgi:hypothetical protein
MTVDEPDNPPPVPIYQGTARAGPPLPDTKNTAASLTWNKGVSQISSNPVRGDIGHLRVIGFKIERNANGGPDKITLLPKYDDGKPITITKDELDNCESGKSIVDRCSNFGRGDPRKTVRHLNFYFSKTYEKAKKSIDYSAEQERLKRIIKSKKGEDNFDLIPGLQDLSEVIAVKARQARQPNMVEKVTSTLLSKLTARSRKPLLQIPSKDITEIETAAELSTAIDTLQNKDSRSLLQKQMNMFFNNRAINIRENRSKIDNFISSNPELGLTNNIPRSQIETGGAYKNSYIASMETAKIYSKLIPLIETFEEYNPMKGKPDDIEKALAELTKKIKEELRMGKKGGRNTRKRR